MACGLATAPMFAARAQPAPPPDPAPTVASMGQPPRWLPHVVGSGVVGGRDARAGAMLLLGVHRPVGSPVVGFGVDGEAYGAALGSEASGGLRLLGTARALNLGAGIDWDARAGNAVFVLSWSAALRRGGLLGHGTMVRADWLPARSQTLAVGLSVPLAQPHAGRTRPRHTGVTLSDGDPVAPAADAVPPPAVEAALAEVREAASLIRLYTNFFSDDDAPTLASSRRAFRRAAERVRDSLDATSARYPGGRDYDAVQRTYVAGLGRLFAAAAGADPAAGLVLGARARAGLLDHVILPYDTLFGRVKNRQRDIDGLTSAAQASFARWLDDSSAVPAARRPAVLDAHARWLGVVDEVQHTLADQWDDSRRIWLPLQLALAPEQHDEQAEVDALIARAAGRPFSGGNEITYLQSTDLPLEFARSVALARDYHVLWIHDFAGRRENGEMDRVGYREVADVYFPALTRAVQRYDSTGRMPTYLVFLDQHYYETNDSRLWMTMLESPLDAPIRLPAGNGEAEAHLRERQQELRAAVAASSRLGAEAARGGGPSWIRAVVKVHVSITQPSDFTFRSHRIIPPLPFLPDNLMRDHRKIAFHDLTEAEPSRGAMIIGGVGIGAHYASPTWDDRGLVLRGPAALEVRAAARRLLRLNGVAEDRIPAVLRDPDRPAPAVGRGGGAGDGVAGVGAQAGGPAGARALQVHNEPGFGPKSSSVARAMLYSLAPRGSVIVVPDPLWLGPEWAGMLAGAALRGCRVFVIAPAVANAPSSAGPTMSQAYDVLSRLLRIQELFGDRIAAAGGELRVGIYAATEDVNDVVRQADEVRAGVARAPWLRELIPFDSATLAVLDTVPALLAAAGYEATAPGRDLAPRPPQLHMKAQLVADHAAIVALARQPQWPRILEGLLVARARQTSADADPGGIAASVDSAGLAAPREALVRGYEATRSEEERRRVSFYFAIGTQNHDARGLMLDGEATVVVSGSHAAVALVDFYFLMARATWIESEAELDDHVPPADDFIRRIARFIRFVL